MRCGTKKFTVKYEEDKQVYTKEIDARSPIKARKNFKKRYGDDLNIISCRKAAHVHSF